MNSIIIVRYILLLFIACHYAHGQSYCAVGWEQYLEKKCFKILPDNLKNFEFAQDLCNKQGPGATLLTIHSQQEQDFLSDLLFTKYKIVDSVWIGAKVSNKRVTWVDESKDDYTNWETGEPSNATDHCVQMEPAAPNIGKWIDEPCSKKNKVVCQNDQEWPLGHIQHVINELQTNQTTIQQVIQDLKQSNTELKEYQKNIVPIGFIYVQLPSQPEPVVLWPKMYWSNVTPSYAGLFFRAEGGTSEKFNGNVQVDDSPRLVAIGTHKDLINETAWTYSVKPGVYTNDLWSGFDGGSAHPMYLNFLVSAAEVRPRNQAIRIWKRIQ